MPLRDLTRDAALRIPRVKAFYVHTHTLAVERDVIAAEREALQARAEAAEARVAELDGRVAQLELRHLEETNGLRRELQAEQARASAERSELEARRTDEHRGAVALSDRLSGELAAVSQAEAAQRAELARLTPILEQFEGQVSHLQRERQRALGRIEELVAALHIREERVRTMEVEVATLRARSTDLEQGCATLDVEAGRLRTQVTELKAELDRERKGALQQGQVWAAERDGLTAELDGLRAERDRMSLSAAVAADREGAAAAQVTELRIREAVLQTEVERLRLEEQRLLEAQAELADMHAQTAVLRSEVARGDAQAAELASVRAEANALRERVGSAEYEVGLLREAAKLDVDPAELAELRTRAAALEAEAKRLRNEERRLGHARAELRELRVEAGTPQTEAVGEPSRAEVLQFFDVLLPSKTAGYMYAFVPKAACTSVKAALWRAEAARSSSVGPLITAKAVHARSHDPDSPWQTAPFASAFHRVLDELLRTRALMITLVRNPFSRIFSAYENKIAGPSDMDVAAELGGMGWRHSDRPSFEEFVALVADQEPVTMNEHWRPQTLLTLNDHVGYDRIFAVENLGRDLPILVKAACGEGARTRPLNVNSTGSEKRKGAAYSERTADLVRRIYAADFQAFGYDPSDLSQTKPDRAALSASATMTGFSPRLTRVVRRLALEAAPTGAHAS